MTKVEHILPQEIYHGNTPSHFTKGVLHIIAEYEANTNGPPDDTRRTDPRDLKVVKRFKKEVEKKYDDGSSSNINSSSSSEIETSSEEESAGD